MFGLFCALFLCFIPVAGLNALDYLALVVSGVNTLRFGSQEGFEELANRRFLCFRENLIIYGNFTYPIFFFFSKKKKACDFEIC